MLESKNEEVLDNLSEQKLHRATLNNKVQTFTKLTEIDNENVGK